MKKTCLLVLMTLFLAACGDSGYEYSSYHCNLTLDNSTHNDATLASAMNAASPGIFCTIKVITKGGAMQYSFETNANLKSTSPFNAIDNRLENQKHVGMNNGLIVGFARLTDMTTGNPVFYAYDLMCPNCFDYTAIPMHGYPLSVKSSGIATCPNCKRQYDLNNGGIISAGDKGTPLQPYRATTTRPFGILHVY